MTLPAPRTRRWPSALEIALPLLLVVALLLPITALFLQTRQTTDDDRSFAVRERAGITYLRSLGAVTIALVDAQSAAVASRGVPSEALTRAVEATTAVDTRLGGELRTRERWAGVRAKIEALPDRGSAGETAFTAYGEISDLLLALYGKVRETSGLTRDPDAHAYYLQDGAAEELPESLVAVGRLADLAVLAANRRAADRDRTIGEFSAARLAVVSPAGDLVEDLLAAVNRPEGGNLGSNLLRQVDGFQRAVEALAAASTPPDPAATTPAGGNPGRPSASGGPRETAGSGVVVNAAQIAAARSNAQAAATELSTIVVTELDAMISARIDDLDGQRRTALGVAGLALLLVIALATVIVLGRRRRPPRPPLGDPPAGPAPTSGADRWEPPAAWTSPVPIGANARLGQPAGAVRDIQPANSGRSDAAR